MNQRDTFIEAFPFIPCSVVRLASIPSSIRWNARDVATWLYKVANITRSFDFTSSRFENIVARLYGVHVDRKKNSVNSLWKTTRIYGDRFDCRAPFHLRVKRLIWNRFLKNRDFGRMDMVGKRRLIENYFIEAMIFSIEKEIVFNFN